MKKNILSKFIFALLTLYITTILSCKKEVIDNTTTPKASITFASPSSSITYSHGDTVYLQALISCTEEMHGYNYVLKNTTSGEEIKNIDVHQHDSVYTLSDYWINDVSAGAYLTLKVSATIDHAGNIYSDSITFHCHP